MNGLHSSAGGRQEDGDHVKQGRGMTQLAIDIMDATTVFGYSDQFSRPEKGVAVGQIVFDGLTGGAASAIRSPVKRVGFEGLLATNDAIDQFYADKAYKNVKVPNASQKDRSGKAQNSSLKPPSMINPSSMQLNKTTTAPVYDGRQNAQATQALLSSLQSVLRQISYYLGTVGAQAPSAPTSAPTKTN